MRLRKLISSVIMALTFVGCAFNPTSPADIAKAQLDMASAAMQALNNQTARAHLAYALTQVGEEGQVARFFEANPTAVAVYVDATKEHLRNVTPVQVATERDRLNLMQVKAVLPSAEIQSLRTYLVDRSKQGNLDGTIRFTLRHNIRDLGLVDSVQHMDIVLRRTLEEAATSRPETRRQLLSLVAYAADPSIPAAQKKLIETSLPTLHITRSDLESLAGVFPEFVKRFKSESTINAALIYMGGDRLSQADLTEMVHGRVKGVVWQDTPGEGAAVVRVERLRHDEREEQRRQNTVRYNDLDVDFINRAFYMPRNSSYLYEVESSPVSIEYGYEVTVLIKGREDHREIVRGTLEAANTSCSGARIENAFGGTSPAGFIANSDMQSRCQASGSRSLEDLREEIDVYVIASILKSPAISRIHAMNQ